MCLTWLLDRECDLRYLGQSRFEVLRSVYSKLEEDATFTVSVMIEGEPLFVDHLMQPSCPQPVAYVAGRINGIHFELIDEEEDV